MADVGRLVVVAGPSGVGKSTVVRAVADSDPHTWLSVSATTRRPRAGEQPGIDYLFVTEPEFEQLRRTGGLLEAATYSGNSYGTPRAAVQDRLEAGQDVLLEIDLQGVRQVRAVMPECLTVFIAPPSWRILEQRLTDRGTEDAAGLQRRLATAKQELLAIDEFDAVVVNADLEQACNELLALIHNRPANPAIR